MKKLILISLASLLSAPVFAADPQSSGTVPATPPASSTTDANPLAGNGERLNVNNLKQKYWAKGEETELRVVQNRLYSKANKLELGVFGGIVSTDPFLNVQSLGLAVNYYFSEYFGVGVIGWKDFAGASSAQAFLSASTNNTVVADTNIPSAFYGLDAKASLIYGKLSVLGKTIIYYDLFLQGGMGLTSTETGSYITPMFGIGQQIYLSKVLSFHLTFLEMFYSETVNHKNASTQPPLQRTNFNNTINLGFNFLL